MYGQVFRLDTLDGVGAAKIRRALTTRRSREIVIVPWDYGQACDVYPWTQKSARWVTPDSLGFFALHIRPESLWAGGRPTFDAIRAHAHSYADGPYTIGPHHVIKNSESGATIRMSRVEDVFSLYVRLPIRGDSIERARIRSFVRANPHLLTSYPGNRLANGWQQ